MDKYIVGLDIGTTKIACFIGQRAENGKISIVGFGKTDSIGVSRGAVINIRSTADSIRRAVADASDMAKFEVKEVYVGIAGQHIKSQTNQGSIMIPSTHRLIEEEDVQHLIDDQYHILLEPGEEIIHVFPQNYIVDNDPLEPDIDPVGVAGKCLVANFHIVTGNTTNLHNIRDAVHEAGLKIKNVVLEPIASALSTLDDRDKGAGVALVDIGGGTTDIAIFQEGIIRHTSVLPLAGNVITNDIRENCQILKHQAESLKIRFGSCLPTSVNQDDIISIPGLHNQQSREISVRTLAGIIKSRMQILLEQVGYEIELSGLQQHLISGVTLTGGGAMLNNIKELSELIIGIDTRIGTPDSHLDKGTSITFENLSHPMYATGIGLVIYGIEAEEQSERKAAAVAEQSAQLPDEPAPQPVEEVQPQRKGRKSKGDRKKPAIGPAITDWLSKTFFEEDSGE